MTATDARAYLEKSVDRAPSDAQVLADEIEGRMRRQEWLPADLAIRAVSALRAASGVGGEGR